MLNLQVLTIVLGVLALIKGLVGLLSTKGLMEFAKSWLKSDTLLRLGGLICLLLAGGLSYGFITEKPAPEGVLLMIIEALLVLEVAMMWAHGTLSLISPAHVRGCAGECLKRHGVSGVRSLSLMGIILGLAFLYLGAYVY